jgi:nucleotide-binding universal stress UspA family protein
VIVVGIDHSDGAKAALRFALEELRLRQATLRAVHAWKFDYLGAPGIMGTLPPGEYEALHSAAESALDATLKEVANAEGVESSDGSSKARLRPRWSRNRETLISSSSAHAGSAASPSSSSGRSANSAPTTQSALW